MPSVQLCVQHNVYHGDIQAVYAQGMERDTPRRARRREKLRALVGPNEGAQAALARGIDTPRSYISAILAGRRGIGDGLAARIEEFYEKPKGWMDSEDLPLWPFSAELHARVMRLNGQELQRLETAIRVHLGMEISLDVINSTLERLSSPTNGPAATVGKPLRQTS